MPSAREEVLARVRRSVEGVAVPTIDRGYRRRSSEPAGSGALLDLLCDRLRDYRADVIRCEDRDDAIEIAVLEVLQQRSVRHVVTPAGIPSGWLPDERRVPDRPNLRVEDLDRSEGVLTGCAVAIAETGTIVLDGSALCGRRAITLVPDLHVCIVRQEQVVGCVPEGMAVLEPAAPLTLVSGPSATSDIELDRVEGVHGPRQLVVIVAGRLR